MPYDPIQHQGQGNGCLECAKMASFRVLSLRWYACN